ncbi:hypothetical protein BP5796_11999 [Coleophoma crateriformis]|uniref:Uncharacterized protein n=1 Tax=Coleophoma crateriformis TaxID=565419 RepID=A0A3D8QB53_9HELO|nr:hypothetical protein BP5796_11999 [Coleophoma crateriformis]
MAQYKRRNLSEAQKKEPNEATEDILFTALAVTLPVLTLAAILIWIVFRYQINQDVKASKYGFPSVDNGISGNAYYVDFNTTSFTTVASWASSVATLLPGFIMTLYSYKVAEQVKRDTDLQNNGRLPTPYQFHLWLQMSSGGVWAAWKGIRYAMSMPRERLVRVVTSVLVVSLLIGYSIWVTDTWLHVATTTVAFNQASDIQQSARNYGRMLPARCLTEEVSRNCTIDYVLSRGDYLNEPVEMYYTLGNLSTTNRVLATEVDGNRFSYLAPATLDPSIDYQAASLAVQSSCSLITTLCYKNIATESQQFNCSPGFYNGTSGLYTNDQGQNRTSGFAVGWFQDPQWTKTMDFSATSNPFYTLFRISVGQNPNDESAIED